MIKQFRFISLIISLIFIGLVSLKLGFVISDWILPSPNNITIFVAIIKLFLGLVGGMSILFILSNLNWILFKASSED